MAKTQVNASKQLKEEGSNHKDTPGVSIPVHALSVPTPQMSQVPETIHHCMQPPFILKGHMT